MFVNVKNFSKLLAIADSCRSKDHVEIAFKMASTFRKTARLTEFEYMKVESILLTKLGLNIQSKWNKKLDIDELLKKSTLGS